VVAEDFADRLQVGPAVGVKDGPAHHGVQLAESQDLEPQGVSQSSAHFDGSHRVILSTLSLVFDAATPMLCRR
jgi:hypothetical protein